MNLIDVVYMVYMFIALYMFFLFIFIFLRNHKNIFDYPQPNRQYSISAIIPTYNKEDTIKECVESLLDVDYPLKEVIVVDDCSTDNTTKIIRQIMKNHKKGKIIRFLKTPQNTGKSAGARNFGLNYAKGEIIAIVDADSFPDRDSISKMVGFFNSEKVAAVTPTILVKNQKTFFEKVQAIEYLVISWTRKLLDYVDSVYVTPGPLALYRKNVLEEVGKFDEESMTEDIEITWRLVYHGYQARMALASNVTTLAPSKLKGWWNQRVRWNIGGLQTIMKYKSSFLRRGTLGAVILPFFIVSLGIGIVGLLSLVYIQLRRLSVSLLSTSYSIEAQTALLRLQEVNLHPSILNFIGIALFILGFFFVLIALELLRGKRLAKQNIFTLVFYMVVYLTMYPGIMMVSIYKYFRHVKTGFKW